MIHDIQFDQSSPCLNGKALDKLFEAYLVDNQRRSQPKTIVGYRVKMRPFFEWWNEYGPSRDWILSADDFSEFEKFIIDYPTFGWNSRNDSLKRLKQMFKWAHRRGSIPIDFSMYVPNLKGAPPAKLPVPLSALKAMLDACWKMAYSLRNRAIIAIFAGTALRLEECASLRVESITLMEDCAGYIDPGTTKNDIPRLVAFDPATGKYIKAWLEVLGAVSGPLFPSRNGQGNEGLSTDGVSKVVADAAKLAGVDVETHDLRRMFATTWSRSLRGESYGQLLQKQLGHSRYETTAIYSKQDIGDVLDVLRKQNVSPISRL